MDPGVGDNRLCTKIERVVVPIDTFAESALTNSLRAVRPAMVLAEATQSELIAVSVVAKPGDRSRVRDKLSCRLAEDGTPVSRIQIPVNGYTIGQGLESSTYGQDSLMVVATRGHERTRFMTGSVAEELVHARHRQPTVLVGPRVDIHAFGLRGPLVWCVDPERPSPQCETAVGGIARQLSMETLAVSVVAPEIAGVSGRPNPSVRATGDLDRSAVPVTMLEGTNPADAIVEYAQAVGASLIGAGTHQRAGLSRLVFGSVAIDIVSRAHCPVLAVHERL